MRKLPSVWSFVERYRVSVILGLVGLILVGLGLLIPRLSLFNPEPEFVPAEKSQVKEASTIKVDVAGAVNNPRVYDLEGGVRVADAIEAAGGLSKKADREWVAKNLNLAQVIGDGTKLYIPKIGELASSSSTSGTSLGVASKKTERLVNINTASASELDTLPRIGPVTAQKIIEGRPYSLIEDLINKKVLGPKTYEGLKDLVGVQ